MEIVNENKSSLFCKQTTSKINEEKLSKKLHQVCNSDGKEIDLKRSAPILHDLGKLP